MRIPVNFRHLSRHSILDCVTIIDYLEALEISLCSEKNVLDWRPQPLRYQSLPFHSDISTFDGIPVLPHELLVAGHVFTKLSKRMVKPGSSGILFWLAFMYITLWEFFTTVPLFFISKPSMHGRGGTFTSCCIRRTAALVFSFVDSHRSTYNT